MPDPAEVRAPDAEGVVVKAEAVEKAEADEPEALRVWVVFDAELELEAVTETLPVGEDPATSLALTVEADDAMLDEAASGKIA